MQEKDIAKYIFKIVGTPDNSLERENKLKLMKFYCEAAMQEHYLMLLKKDLTNFFNKYKINDFMHFYIDEEDDYYFISYDDDTPQSLQYNELFEIFNTADQSIRILEYLDSRSVSCIKATTLHVLDDFLSPKQKEILSLVNNCEKNELEEIIKKTDTAPTIMKV